MSHVLSTNYTAAGTAGSDFQYSDAANDPYLRLELQKLGKAVEFHDHASGRGLGVARIAANAVHVAGVDLTHTATPAAPSAGFLRLYAKSDNKVYVRTSGATEIEIGGGAIGQIAFPATQNPSADANTLDDYEEGTWTPLVGGTATYPVGGQDAVYTKVGRLVAVQGRIVITLIGTGSTNLLSGLPFASSPATTRYSGHVGLYASIATNMIFVACHTIATGGTGIQFAGASASGAAMTDNFAIFGNSTEVNFGLNYCV